MTLDELKAAISKGLGTEADSVIEGIVGLINEEKQRGIAAYNAKDKELLSLKNEIKETGFTPEQHSSLKEYVKTLGKKASSSEEQAVTINSLNERLTQLMNEVTATKAEQQAALQKAATETLRSKLTSALGDRIYGPNFVIDSLLQNGEVSLLEGKPVWGGLEFEQGLEKFMKANAGITKPAKTNGTGVPGSNSAGLGKIEEMSVDEVASNLTAIKAELGI
jgi:uncharacterized small protein (DUF1192 family)